MRRPPLNQVIELVYAITDAHLRTLHINIFQDGSYSVSGKPESPTSTELRFTSLDRKQVRKAVISALDVLEKKLNESRRETSTNRKANEADSEGD